jgi:hypothetical protein
MKTLRFGIEIETVGLHRGILARAIHSVVGGTLTGEGGDKWNVTDSTGRVWQIVHDGSLNGGWSSGEIVSPILTYDDLEQLQNIVRAVRQAGARADESTGIHVHVDGSRFDVKSVINLVKFVHKQERLLEHVFAAHERRLYYCRPINPAFLERIEKKPPKTLRQLSEAWYGRRQVTPTRRHESRYHGLNLNSFFYRRTVEFRYFNGTLDDGEVLANVQLVLALAANALDTKTASSKRRDFDPATAKYDFRVVLLRLGFIGAEFKTARLHLTKRLAGSAAWKRGRRDKQVANPPGTSGEGDPRVAA